MIGERKKIEPADLVAGTVWRQGRKKMIGIESAAPRRRKVTFFVAKLEGWHWYRVPGVFRMPKGKLAARLNQRQAEPGIVVAMPGWDNILWTFPRGRLMWGRAPVWELPKLWTWEKWQQFLMKSPRLRDERQLRLAITDTDRQALAVLIDDMMEKGEGYGRPE